MQICFIKDGTSLTLPVTPAGYSWAVGRNMETINISQLGDRVTVPAAGAALQVILWNACCRGRIILGWSRAPSPIRSTTWTF